MDATFSGHVIDQDHKKIAAPGITLSKREQEALQWAAEGKTEWEIGMILGLSEHTAEKFIRPACAKLQTKSRTHAVAKAIRLRLIA